MVPNGQLLIQVSLLDFSEQELKLLIFFFPFHEFLLGSQRNTSIHLKRCHHGQVV